MPTHLEIARAKRVLEESGHVVLREKSYRAAQQRQAIAQAERQWAINERQSQDLYCQSLHAEIRDLRARCTYLYGVARAKGATAEVLAGESVNGRA